MKEISLLFIVPLRSRQAQYLFGQFLLRLWDMCNDPELLKHPQSVPHIPAFDDLVARKPVNPNSGKL